MVRPWYKLSLVVCFMAICLLIASPAVHAQDTSPPVSADVQAAGQPFNAEAAILQALEKNETLSSFQKLRIRLALKYRPRVRAEIIGEVTALCIEEGYVSEDGVLLAPPSGQVDWDAIIEFIERLIPLILKLISLFA
jgi:hypothetical protein